MIASNIYTIDTFVYVSKYKQQACTLFSPSTGNAQKRKTSWSNSLVNMLMTDLLANVLTIFTWPLIFYLCGKVLIFVMLLADGHGLSQWLNHNKPECMDLCGMAPWKISLSYISIKVKIKTYHDQNSSVLCNRYPACFFWDLICKIWVRADPLWQERTWRAVMAHSDFSRLSLSVSYKYLYPWNYS